MLPRHEELNTVISDIHPCVVGIVGLNAGSTKPDRWVHTDRWPRRNSWREPWIGPRKGSRNDKARVGARAESRQQGVDVTNQPLASCQIVQQQVSISIEGGVHFDGLIACHCDRAVDHDPQEALSAGVVLRGGPACVLGACHHCQTTTGESALFSEQTAERGALGQKEFATKAANGPAQCRYDKAQCSNTGLVEFARRTRVTQLILASWETLPQVEIVWTGDVNFDGLTILAIVIVWLVRKKR